MTRLLISVRSAAEARIAGQHGVDILDVKEPTAGAMGRATVDVLESVRAAVPNARLSMAAGELLDPAIHDFDWNAVPGFEFVKVAPAGLRTPDAWRSAWDRWIDCFTAAESGNAQGVQPSHRSHRRAVAVAYADSEAADTLDPIRLVNVALEMGVRQFLLDTFVKDGTRLFHHVCPDELSQLANVIHASHGWIGCAGSLDLHDISTAMSCGADLVAFRGAACDSGREGRISANKIAGLRAELKQCFKPQKKSNATRTTPSP
jgi:uncharacterized protein (UPF0264 family)